MKFDDLTAIAHNISDSLASGVGLLIGVYVTDVFGEANNSSKRCLVVDFLTGKVINGTASPALTRAVALYGKVLPELCARHGGSTANFRELTASYVVDPVYGPRFVVTVEDQNGRRGTDEYNGDGGGRVKWRDVHGRVRRKRTRVTTRQDRS